MSRRVVVTGSGVVSALGDSPAALYSALVDGQSGISQIESFETTGLGCDRAGEIKGFKPRDHLGRRNLRALDRTGALVTTATALALEDAGWNDADREVHELGIVLGTMFCSIGTIAAFDRRAAEAGPIYASPFDFANSVINAAAGQAAIWHDLRGMNSTIACGAASGLRAIAYAAEAISAGRVDVVIAGGAEELCFESFLAFDRAGRLCRTGPDATACSVPLHRDRTGSVLGEGAALVVLEAAETAAARGASPRAEILGHATAFDPGQGEDAQRAMQTTERSIANALTAARLTPQDVAGLSIAADGSPEDLDEAKALASVFGDENVRLPVFTVAANLGQCLGAGGGMQMVAAVESLLNRRLPGVAGLEATDPACPLQAVQSLSAELDSGALLLNAASFDGHRCSLVLAPGEDGS